jgi:hypothetical protein
MNPKLTPERLSRRAIVYIRQSSAVQVMHNQESQRRQYGLNNTRGNWDLEMLLSWMRTWGSPARD